MTSSKGLRIGAVSVLALAALGAALPVTGFAKDAQKEAAEGLLGHFEIRMIGTDDHDLGNAVLAASGVESVRKQDDITTDDLMSAARGDYAKIVGALYAKGYYSGVVHVLVDGREASTISPFRAPTYIRSIVISVTPGPLFNFGETSAKPLAPDTEMPKGFVSGQPAESGTIVSAASAAVSGWKDAGYAKAAISSQKVIADHRSDKLNVELGFAPGPKTNFGTMSVSGQKRVDPDRIRKIAGFPTGEPYDPALEDKVTQRLRRTGTFRSVVLTPADTVGPDGRLDYKLVVAEAKPRRLTFGAELTSDEGATLSGGWMHRNILGGAEKLSIDGEISGIGATTIGSSSGGAEDYSLTTRLERPGTPYADSTAFVEWALSRDQEEDYTSDNSALTFGLTRYISDTLTAEAGLGYEASKVHDDTGENFTYQQIIAPLSLTWDKRDNPLDATSGWYLMGKATPFLGIQTTGDGASLSFDARAYFSPGSSNRFTIAGRFQGGAIVGPGIRHTPRNYLFYSGGGGTVRGQPYQSLGVTEVDEDVKTGGTKYLAGSIEFRGDITDSIGLVAFYDAGYVEGDYESGSQAGAGIGLRYNTSIGPIRFDVANPVSGDTGEGVQIYIGIGQAF